MNGHLPYENDESDASGANAHDDCDENGENVYAFSLRYFLQDDHFKLEM